MREQQPIVLRMRPVPERLRWLGRQLTDSTGIQGIKVRLALEVIAAELEGKSVLEHVTRKVTLTVEMQVAGPQSASEAMKVAEQVIEQSRAEWPSGVSQVKVVQAQAARQ
jgi:hypothetical protein